MGFRSALPWTTGIKDLAITHLAGRAAARPVSTAGEDQAPFRAVRSSPVAIAGRAYRKFYILDLFPVLDSGVIENRK
jgi:hypothetical protein